MARILIASLGKGFEDRDTKEWKYTKADYIIEGNEEKIYDDREFITSALEEHFNIDKTIYIGTVGSMWENIYSYYCKKYEIDEDLDYKKELFEITKSATKNSDIFEINSEKFNEIFQDKVEMIITKYGMNENEITETFNSIMKIGDKLKDGDEIYLDITHSFRSNAMWMFLVMNYIKDVLNKEIEIKMISYGMFEAKELKNGKYVTPVVNLKSFYDLLRWIKGANAFKNYGNGYEFLEMLKNKELENSIQEFSDSMNLNYIANIKDNIHKIKNFKNSMDELEGPAKLLLPEILNSFANTFVEDEEVYWTMLKLAKWHTKHKRYSMAYINVVEAIYIFGAKILNLDVNNMNNKEKEKIRNFITAINSEKKYKNLSEEEIKNRVELSKIFEKAREIRNMISHTLEDKTEMEEIILNIEKTIKKLEKLFNYNYSSEIQVIGNQNLRDNITYDNLEKMCEKGDYKEAGKIVTDGIYSFLFEMLKVEEIGVNKNIVINWLDNKEEKFVCLKEKEDLSNLMKYFEEVKNGKKNVKEKEIIKKIRTLKNIIINKRFIESFENINLFDKVENEKEIVALIFDDTVIEREGLKKYKVKKIKKLKSETSNEWRNAKNDDNRDDTINRFQKIIENNLESGDILVINGEIGITFEIVTWAKKKGIVSIYKNNNTLEFIKY